MARIRTIKPEFWTSEQVMELSPMARLLFIGLWNFCDDRGVHPVAFKTLKAEVFPADDVTASQVEQWVGDLVTHGLLDVFQDDSGRSWWHVTGWHHQLINRPSKTRYPEPPRIAPLPLAAGQDDSEMVNSDGDEHNTHGALTEDSLSTHGALTEDSLTEGKGREGKGKERIVQKQNIPPGRGRAPPGKPGDVLDSTWADFLALRKAKRSPMTATALNAIRSEAGLAGLSLQAALVECCARGWQGFRADWVQQGQPRASPRHGSASAKQAATERFWEQMNGQRGEVRDAIDGEAVRVG